MRYESVVLVRRAEEAEARAALRAAEQAERLGRAALEEREAVVGGLRERLETARAQARAPLSARPAATLQAADERRRALAAELDRTVAERDRAAATLSALGAQLERARVALSEAIRRRQGAETEARRRRTEAARLRERREEASSADAVLAMRKAT